MVDPQPAPGAIEGTGSVEVCSFCEESYNFNQTGTSYGYIDFRYLKGSDWERTQISAPYGVVEGDGSTAPSTGYNEDWVDVDITASFFFRPDENHYGHLDITGLSKNSTTTFDFEWIIQTEENNRELY